MHVSGNTSGLFMLTLAGILSFGIGGLMESFVHVNVVTASFQILFIAHLS